MLFRRNLKKRQLGKLSFLIGRDINSGDCLIQLMTRGGRLMYKLPKSFYFKVLFIILIYGWFYLEYRPIIDATIQNPDIPMTSSIQVIFQEILTESNLDSNFDTHLREEINGQAENKSMAQPGNTTPYLISNDVVNHPRFQVAVADANEFNTGVDVSLLNEHFKVQVNEMRNQSGWDSVEVGWYLAEGTEQRIHELSTYHYLSKYTIDGNDFRSLFSGVESSEFRLGENLYELFISAGDIHLSTWQNEEILAEYLYEVFEDSISSSNYHLYSYQYITIRAEATDYQINNTPYVRLVVSLVMDTGEGEI